MSAEKKILGYRVRLNKPPPIGGYVVGEGDSWDISDYPPRPVSRKLAQTIYARAMRWHKWATSGRHGWYPLWTSANLRIVRVVRREKGRNA